MVENCISCAVDITSIDNSVVFNCPQCGVKIVRCGDCRQRSVNYTCKCGFKGW